MLESTVKFRPDTKERLDKYRVKAEALRNSDYGFRCRVILFIIFLVAIALLAVFDRGLVTKEGTAG